MNKLIISAPFGNYLNWPNCTSTLGTYTLQYRGGFWWRAWKVLSTVRYYYGLGAWKNKLGLPNGGINSLLPVDGPLPDLSSKIVSITARKTEDWETLLKRLSYNDGRALEMNVSCPNTPGEKDETDYREVFKLAATCSFETIVKLPPVNYEERAEVAMECGIRSFHACNTLVTPGGGLSGKPLKALSLSCIRWLLGRGVTLKRIIGGGGVTHLSDANEYLDAGATNVAVASVLFNPLNWRRIKTMAAQLNTVCGNSEVPDAVGI